MCRAIIVSFFLWSLPLHHTHRKKDIYLLLAYFLSSTTSCTRFVAKNQNKISEFKVNSQTTKAEVSRFCISNTTLIVTTYNLSLPTADTFLKDMHLKIKFQYIQECILKLFSYHFLILDMWWKSELFLDIAYIIEKSHFLPKKNPNQLRNLLFKSSLHVL